MRTSEKRTSRIRPLCCVAVLLLVTGACSREPKQAGVRVIPAGKPYSGFLSNYARLKPNPNFENTVSYVGDDPIKNLHKYVAVMVDPVVIYVATDDASRAMPDRGRTALAQYFQQALTWAVTDAFPVVQEPGPLVLRLRSALIGVDVGGAVQGQTGAGGKPPERAINIGKVVVEMELTDSETGEQIAAVVDRRNLGEGAEIGSETHDERFREATRACRGWASRLREFLDDAEELSEEDVDRIEANQRPYGTNDK